ncbi:MAG: 6-carboxytetrahydropterin synthase QueD [Myxococcota bacterium]
MRCQLVREYHFEAAHRLPRVPPDHQCSRLHGHSYRIEITLAGEIDPDMGWLVDFSEVDVHVDPIIARLDHQLLNEIEGLSNPTSEILAVWLWNQLKGSLPLMTAISVSETATARCVYRGE